jgi:hypothetical protein
MDIKQEAVAVEGEVKNFVTNHKLVVLYAVLAVLIAGLGFVVGRYLSPPKTVVTEKVREVTKTQVVTQIKTEIQVVKVHDQQQQEKIHRTIVEGVDPPGCKSKTTTEDINIDTVVHDNTHDTTIQYVDRVVEKWQDRIVEKQTKVLTQPDWSLYAGIGVDATYFLGQGQHGIPGLQGFVVQAGIDRRILGPFWMGVFGNSEGVAGLNLRVTW